MYIADTKRSPSESTKEFMGISATVQSEETEFTD